MSKDGSVDINFVAQYLGTSVEKVKEAAFPEEGHKKEIVIMNELISYSKTEAWIAALGGMVFKFSHPLVIT